MIVGIELPDDDGHHKLDLDRVLPVVYDELRRIARRQLLLERSGHTLQPTALVHEAYLRLRKDREADWPTKAVFLQAAAQAMRRILVDHARRHDRQKRGGSRPNLNLEDGIDIAQDHAPQLIELDECLTRLARLDARQAQIVELRFFAGLSIEETATTLGLSPRTIKRDWSLAKVWLYGELTGEDAEQ